MGSPEDVASSAGSDTARPEWQRAGVESLGWEDSKTVDSKVSCTLVTVDGISHIVPVS